MKQHQHISDQDLIAFQNHTFRPEEQMEFLSHISSCTHCSDQLASHMNGQLMEAPRRMKETLLAKAQSPEVQLVVKSKEVSKKIELLWYSLKVGAATVGALLLLATTIQFGNLGENTWEPPIKQEHEIPVEEEQDTDLSFTSKLRDNADKLSNQMQNFTNNILKGGN